jgi:TP901 family phage tail tape measure protein
MAAALSELFVEINARTAGFDAAMARTRSGLSAATLAASKHAAAFAAAQDRIARGGRRDGVNEWAARNAAAIAAHARLGQQIARSPNDAAAIAVHARLGEMLDRSRAAAARAHSSFAGLSTGVGHMRNVFSAASVAVGTFAGNVASRLAAMAVPVAGNVLGGAAIDMERRVVGLAKASDLGGAKLAGMKEQIFALSTSLRGIRLDDLFAIATVGSKMGVANEDLLRYTEGVAKVSIALDDMPAEEIATQIGKINNIWKLGVDGAFQLGSAVDKLADSGASSADQIFNVMQRVGKSTKGLGMSAQETLALSTAITDTGTRSEQAATSLVQLTNALVDTESHATFGKVLGISADEFALRVKAGPMEALKAFLTQLQTFDSGSQNQILKGIGIEGAQNPTEIKGLAESLEPIARYTRLANIEFAGLNQLETSYAANSAMTSAALDVASNKFQIMAVTIGDQMLPVIGLATDFFGAFVDGITAGVGRNVDDFARLRDSMIATARAAGGMSGVVARSLAVLPEAMTAAGLDILGLFSEDAARAAEELRGARAGALLAEALPGTGGPRTPAAPPPPRKPTEIPALPKGPEGLDAAGKRTFVSDEKEKKEKEKREWRSEATGLAAFAAKFRQEQFTGRDRAAEARKEAELNRLALKENTKALQQQMKSFGFLA